MHLQYWWEAFLTAVFLINNLPSFVLAGQSSFECMFNKTVNFDALKVFGYACYPCLRPYQKHKFEFHTERCVYLGPSPSHKGFKCMNVVGQVFISRHVRFDEGIFPFQQGFPTAQASPPIIITPPPITTWFVHPHISPPTDQTNSTFSSLPIPSSDSSMIDPTSSSDLPHISSWRSLSLRHLFILSSPMLLLPLLPQLPRHPITTRLPSLLKLKRAINFSSLTNPSSDNKG